MVTDTCPRCGVDAAVLGNCSRDWSDFGPSRFAPHAVRWWKLALWMQPAFLESFRACGACGFVWNEVDPAELRAFVRKLGDDESRRLLARVPSPAA